MGRPLTGSLRSYQGLWWASVPEARGASRRRHESFVAEDDARSWLAQAVAAVRQGSPLPDPNRFRTQDAYLAQSPRTTRAAPYPARHRVRRPRLDERRLRRPAARRAGTGRAGPAHRRRRTWSRGSRPAPTTITDVSYLMAHEWLLRLVGRDRPGSPGNSRSWLAPMSSDGGEGELSLAEAAQAAGVSLPTVRRRWRAGQLPGAYRDHTGRVRVPVAAVAAITTKPRAPVGLSQGYVADALWVLRRILAFARANGLFPPGFDPTEGLDAPLADKAAARNASRGGQPRPLTLGECAGLASHLHPVHQLAFWIQRIMGLRISEAFGITVGDVVDLGDTGLLAVQGQGGRTFTVRDDHGQIVAVPYKPTLKTAAGSRVLVVPPKLMELLRVAIEAFHTDPDTGEIDTTARLVPGLQTPNRSGQHAYRHAFDEAATAEQISSDHLGFSVSTHLLRKSLRHRPGLDRRHRRRRAAALHGTSRRRRRLRAHLHPRPPRRRPPRQGRRDPRPQHRHHHRRPHDSRPSGASTGAPPTPPSLGPTTSTPPSPRPAGWSIPATPTTHCATPNVSPPS